jgi:hypothetical protein
VSLPGGSTHVDCVGNCQTGRGYCYASDSGLCANCVLYDPDPSRGEVLCADHSGGHAPQGGPLPDTDDWHDGCAATSLVQDLANCTAGLWERAGATLAMIFRGELVYLTAPTSIGNSNPHRSDGDLDFASLACIDHGRLTPLEGLLDRKAYEMLKMSPSCVTARQLVSLMSGSEGAGCDA